ncbi:MAG: DMT family transporter [Alphaproteobacteria bacterium]|nr:DMT family transporter [Alphaproteobacteria bacterium]
MGLSNTQKGILLAFIGFNCFTISDACIKWMGDHYDVTTIIFWIYLIILIIGTIYALFAGVNKTLTTHKPVIHIARGIFMLITTGFAVSALSTSLSLATLYTIIFLNPMLITIAAIPLYKEPVSKRHWQIIILGFTGIIVAFHKDVSIFTPQIFYAFCVLFACTITNLLARPIDKRDHILTLSFYPALITVPAILIYTHGYVPLPSTEDIPVFILVGITTLLALSCVSHGFRIAPHAAVAPTQYTQMIFGIIIGYYVFGDVPGTWLLIGAGIIISSGLLLVMQKKI